MRSKETEGKLTTARPAPTINLTRTADGKDVMATDIRLKEALPEITEAIVATYTECSRTSHLGHKPLPSREAVVEILCDLLDILYPGYWRRQNLHIGNVEYHVGDLIDRLHDSLTQQVVRALRHEHDRRRAAARRRSTWKRWPSRRRSSC